MQFLKLLLTWWNNQTIGTLWWTKRRGVLVGQDAQGNLYYTERDGQSINGKPRRWVIYNGDVEATRVPPEWHGWLHYTVDETPDEAGFERRDWHQPHQSNQTGLETAHKPAGPKDAASYPAGYDAWKPE